MKRILASLLFATLAGCAGKSPGGSLIPHNVVNHSTAAVSFPSMIHQQLPLPGTGSAGSAGPEKIGSLLALPQVSAGPELPFPDVHARIDLTAPLQYLPNIIEGALATYTYEGVPTSPPSSRVAGSSIDRKGTASIAVRRPMTSIAPNSTFITAGDQDLGAATNGTYILQTRASGTFSIYTMSGAPIATTAYTSIYCPATNPLPICSANYNPGPGDNRVIYDPGSQRWVMSSLWVDAGVNTGVPPTASIAVSESADPTGSWYVYQFPNCGTSDSTTIGDQPRLGFNSQWIVITSSCSLSTDASLQVFDKNNLYAGGGLSLNQNWFQFADSSNVNNKDNPARTYVSTINNREYLTFVRDDTSTGYEQVVYSHVEGSIDSPVFYSETDAVDSNVPFTNGGGVTTLDAPGCTACVGGETNGTIHSSDVFELSNGSQYILSTNVEADATYSNADDLLATAISAGGSAITLAVLPTENGQGAIASEIGMPLVQNIVDTASIAYDYSDPNFYPGMFAAQWNLDDNGLDYNNVLQQGNVVPPGCSPPTNCTVTRIADYIDAFAPIPASSQFIEGGDVLNSSATNDREIFWANLSIEPHPSVSQHTVAIAPNATVTYTCTYDDIELKGKCGVSATNDWAYTAPSTTQVDSGHPISIALSSMNNSGSCGDGLAYTVSLANPSGTTVYTSPTQTGAVFTTSYSGSAATGSWAWVVHAVNQSVACGGNITASGTYTDTAQGLGTITLYY